jgi:hypothetical protein
VTRARFTPDERRVISVGGNDKSVFVWRVVEDEDDGDDDDDDNVDRDDREGNTLNDADLYYDGRSHGTNDGDKER